ncbi:hypothetical protein FIBSPDRAFT_324948 [Athelia psychrophila]|uniref:Uncharacterized protein n=1 Tax=Athelia psychrophila TaxID=1759441 RepID=A0A167WLV1_9AGAM|nr:hypothetical protein FIBSPDRAFT_324948 [Fibularhizoctonia sp. CBS 109695]
MWTTTRTMASCSTNSTRSNPPPSSAAQSTPTSAERRSFIVALAFFSVWQRPLQLLPRRGPRPNQQHLPRDQAPHQQHPGHLEPLLGAPRLAARRQAPATLLLPHELHGDVHLLPRLHPAVPGAPEGHGRARDEFIFLFYAAYNLAFATLIVSYTMGILPYHLRAKGSVPSTLSSRSPSSSTSM